VFLLALAGASLALTASAPFPKLGNLWRKFHHLSEHARDYSLIYVGSSRVFHEFIPEHFDAALAGRGHEIRSFNFGQDGMWPPESLYMTRKILALRPPKLRWVLIDLMGIKPAVDGNESSLRALHWHDWQHTVLAWRHIAGVDMAGQRSFAEKAGLILHHAGLWARRATGMGRGHEALETALKLQREKRPAPVLDGGFERGGDGPLRGDALELFKAEVSRLRREPAQRPIQPELRDALSEIAADVRAAGAEPVFIVAAGIYGSERFSDWPPPGIRVLAFDDPAKYPQLYDPERRYDPHHLDTAGAAEFTRLLAARFGELLEEKR
jgi:hypothetical protein